MAKKQNTETQPQGPPAENPEWPEVTEKRSLPCKLSAGELAERADELARGQIDLERIEDEKKSAASEYKARIDGKTAELSRLSHVITARAEHRQVKCRWVYTQSGFNADGTPIWHPEQKTLVREDTGEAVEIRQITDDERQMKLKIDEQAAVAAAESPQDATPVAACPIEGGAPSDQSDSMN